MLVLRWSGVLWYRYYRWAILLAGILFDVHVPTRFMGNVLFCFFLVTCLGSLSCGLKNTGLFGLHVFRNAGFRTLYVLWTFPKHEPPPTPKSQMTVTPPNFTTLP